MKTALLALILTAFVGQIANVNGQPCMYSNLSKIFDYQINANHIKSKDSTTKSAVVKLLIRDKKTSKLVDVISLTSPYIFNNTFSNCDAVRSYVTEINTNKNVSDYDYGDLVVVDLNFDGKEDLAIKFDSGGNGGPLYKFFLQGNNRRFHLDKFLTDSVESFPSIISRSKRTISTQIHANYKQEIKRTFYYNDRTKRWTKIASTMIDFD